MHIDPTRAQFDAFKAMDRSLPVNMLNLIALREQATYSDHRIASGREAYEAYGRESRPIFEKVGGKIIWRGRPQAALIGPAQSENWDISFIARYPSLAAFLQMVTDPEYQAIVYHRQAAVADSRLVPHFDANPGSGFAERL